MKPNSKLFVCSLIFGAAQLVVAEVPAVKPVKPVKPMGEMKPIKPIEVKPMGESRVKPVEGVKGSDHSAPKVAAPKVGEPKSTSGGVGRPSSSGASTAKMPTDITPQEGKELLKLYRTDEQMAPGEAKMTRETLQLPKRATDLESAGLTDFASFVESVLKGVPEDLHGSLREQIFRMYQNADAAAKASGKSLDFAAFKEGVSDLVTALVAQSAKVKKVKLEDGKEHDLSGGFVKGAFEYLGSHPENLKQAAKSISELEGGALDGYALMLSKGSEAFEGKLATKNEKGELATVVEADRAFMKAVGELFKNKGISSEEAAKLAACTFNPATAAALVAGAL